MKRFERKYILNYQQYTELRSYVEKILPRDSHDTGNGYQVHSIYFDSDDFRLARNKVNGEAMSLRLRKRTYDDGISYMECKSEINGAKFKVREKEKSTECENNFLKSIMSSISLSSMLEITYKREAFQSNSPNFLRINFDTEITSTYNTIHPIIMEVKTLDPNLPSFLINILNSYNLKNTKYSKYISSITGLNNE